MSLASRLRRRLGALMLPLALWTAVPGIQWCPLGWDEVRAECFTACTARPAVVEAGAAGCCERACSTETRRPLCGDPDGGESCSAEAPSSGQPAIPDAGFPGGRAYCLSGPSGGDGVPHVPPQAPDTARLAALVPGADLGAVAPERDARPVVVTVAHPPPPPTGAVPRGRAPPELSRIAI